MDAICTQSRDLRVSLSFTFQRPGNKLQHLHHAGLLQSLREKV